MVKHFIMTVDAKQPSVPVNWLIVGTNIRCKQINKKAVFTNIEYQ